MQRLITFGVGALLFLVEAAGANAGLVVTVPSATFNTTDGTDTIDVTITDTGDGSPANPYTPFGAFTLSFAITPDASNAMAPLESLQFNSTGDAALGPTLPQAAGYVFYGNSLDVGPPASPFVSSLTGGNTLLTVDDSTGDFSDVTLANGTSALLAQLVFSVPTNITNSAGDEFDIMLVDPDTSPTALQSNYTGDVQVGGTFLGVVTLEQPSPNGSVPEPGTLGMLTLGMTGLGWLKRRRR